MHLHPLPPVDTEPAEAYRSAAMLAADWLVRNQVRDPNDANRGRFPGGYDLRTGKYLHSINWTTATGLMGLLATWKRTKEEKYLEAAVLAGEYLKSLQMLDEDEPGQHGYLREVTPQTQWGFPRDALTAAWGLLWLYQATNDEDYLRAVWFFNEWYMREALVLGWPLWGVDLRGDKYINEHLEGSFHGGNAAYFHDYKRVTGMKIFSERGIRFTADYYMKTFLQEDGSVKVIHLRDGSGYLDGEDSPKYPAHWQRMHRYNDDFAAIGLLAAYMQYGGAKYLAAARRHAEWLLSEQRPDGSFGDPAVPPASATAPMLFLDLYRLTGEARYFDAAHRAGSHLLTLQVRKPEDPIAHGGFRGYCDETGETGHFLNLRTGAYALIALWKLEGEVTTPYYSVFGLGTEENE